VSPTINGESLWPRLAGLPLVIEACEYERLHAVLAYEFERRGRAGAALRAGTLRQPPPRTTLPSPGTSTRTRPAERLSAAADIGVADPTDGRASENAHLLSQGSRSYGVNSFQCPSETTSTAPSVTLMAV
jgi:hypothetical protein